jgi:uncharacterized protein YlxP (DUF503 family)
MVPKTTDMHVSALELDLHLPNCHSLKEKRAVLKSILNGAQNRFAVAAAEVAHLDKWQRAGLGFACVSGSAGHADEVMTKVERFVVSFPEVELIEAIWGVDA